MNANHPSPRLLLIRVNLLPGIEAGDPVAIILDFNGGKLLADLLRVELSADGLLTESTASPSPTLSRGICLFGVSDISASAHLVLSVLERNGLKQFVTLFQFDEAEEVWRSFYPQTGADTITPDVFKQLLQEQGRRVSALEKWRTYLATLGIQAS